MTARLLEHFDRVVEGPGAVPRLRRFILDLAMRGKLVEQDPNERDVSEVSLKLGMPPGEVEDVHLFDIPPTWRWVQLGRIAAVVMGQSPPGVTYNKTGEGLPLINGPVEFTEGPFGQTIVNQYTTAPTTMCEQGDFLICVRGSTTGRTNIAGFRACIGRGIAAIRPSVGDAYIRLVIWRMRESIIAMGRGIAFPSVTRQQLQSLPVPLPPLSEQSRIVAKVDELMALCDLLEATHVKRETRRDRVVVASLQRLTEPANAPQSKAHTHFHLSHFPRLTGGVRQIRHLRRTTLDCAVRGRLVAQDPRDEPAWMQLQRIEEQKSSLPDLRGHRGRRETAPKGGRGLRIELPNGWAATTLGDLATKITDGTHKTPRYVSKGVPFISVKDFSGGKLDFSNTRFITQEEHAVLYRRCDPHRGDILIGRIGTLGKAVLVDTDLEFSLFVSVGLIRFLDEHTSPLFLRLLLNSPFVAGEFDRIKIGGATHTNKLNLGDLHTVMLPLPPLDEQHRIVAKVDELMALCDRLETRIIDSERASNGLLEALLHEALAGPSTPHLMEAR